MISFRVNVKQHLSFLTNAFNVPNIKHKENRFR
ncbi:hypothetical protein FGIG_03324 [Fasciola gigantica]|uniref:Uncharacterized protein n=1 Tax=Fasciola gigantica TaxID=46835 RepID=A0A504YKA9_FASGI|nr:hypothetical protein FGIG_03324 [Fasciola gigantica]